MTYGSTQDKFLRFPFSVRELPDFGSQRPEFGSQRPDLESERPYLRLWGGGDVRKTETGENCPMWNHRSSAPPGPLPKNDVSG